MSRKISIKSADTVEGILLYREMVSENKASPEQQDRNAYHRNRIEQELYKLTGTSTHIGIGEALHLPGSAAANGLGGWWNSKTHDQFVIGLQMFRFHENAKNATNEVKALRREVKDLHEENKELRTVSGHLTSQLENRDSRIVDVDTKPSATHQQNKAIDGMKAEHNAIVLSLKADIKQLVRTISGHEETKTSLHERIKSLSDINAKLQMGTKKGKGLRQPPLIGMESEEVSINLNKELLSEAREQLKMFSRLAGNLAVSFEKMGEGK